MKLFKRVLPLLLAMCLLCGAMLPIAAEENEPAEDVEQAEDFLLGDVDGDGKVTTTDARFILQRCIIKMPLPNPGEPGYEKWERYILCGDVDGDEWVTATDARLILQYIVGRIDHFPAEDM